MRLCCSPNSAQCINLLVYYQACIDLAAKLFQSAQEVHGTGDIPLDYADGAHPDWVEAARWLERQRDLYRRQKLLLVRVRLIKELLGERLQ